MATNAANILDRGITYAKGLDTKLRVKTHTQAVSDEIRRRFNVTQVSTYSGHSPTPDRALDIFPVSRAEGDRIATWLIQPDVMAFYGITYVIWYQRIYNPSIALYWRDMPDRGGITANHKDHVHQSSNPTGPAGSKPKPKPTPQEEEIMLIVWGRPGSGDNAGRGFLWIPTQGYFEYIGEPKDVDQLTAGGATHIELSSGLIAELIKRSAGQ